MTPDAEDHYTAFLALITAASAGTSLQIHDGEAPGLADPPYLSIYPDPGLAHRGERLGAARLDGGSYDLDMVVQITAVGGTRWQASWAHKTAHGAVIDQRLVVADRTCLPVVQAFAQPIRPDVQNPKLYVAFTGYRIRSMPS